MRWAPGSMDRRRNAMCAATRAAATRAAAARTMAARAVMAQNAASHGAASAHGSPARGIMVALAAAVLLLAAGGPVGGSALTAQQPADSLARAADASRVRGAEDAAVVVYEIGDFECPYCARFSREVFPRLDSAYIRTGRVRWVYINFPVPSHPRAWAAAEAALCAGAVGDRFWAMHDRLYEAREEWSSAEDPAALFARYARDLDLSVEGLDACMQRDDVATTLVQDVMSATSAEVRGTPTFIIDGERSIVGLRGFEEWQRILDEALAAKDGTG